MATQVVRDRVQMPPAKKADSTVAARQRRASSATSAVTQLLEAHADLDVDLVAAELDRRRRVAPLARVIEAWDMSFTDVAEIFSVSRQAVAKWAASGVPAERAPAMANLAAATDLLVRHLKRERIPAVVRREAQGLGGRSLVQIAEAGDTQAVLVAVREMFAFENATA